jgi:hypothetical protein
MSALVPIINASIVVTKRDIMPSGIRESAKITVNPAIQMLDELL